MSTTLGIELEIIPTAGNEVGFSARIKRALEASGYTAIENSHFGRTYSSWQVKPDSTVKVTRNGTTYYGTEVVSPVLTAGPDAWRKIRNVCAILEENGATANINCGMHVHVGVQNRTLAEFKNIVRAYGTYSEQIDSVLPKSRRREGSKSCWAQPLWTSCSRTRMLQRIDNAETMAGLCSAVTQHIRGYRYGALNLEPYSRLGTIEFRQHSGTVDANKAASWAQWCVAFVERYSQVNVLDADTAIAAQDQPTGAPIQGSIDGRGERRMPRRACPTKRMIEAMATGQRYTAAEVVAIARDPKGELGEEHVWGWLKYAARTTGFGFFYDASGRFGMLQTSPTVQAQALSCDPFRNCFDLFEGALIYFGRRRSALA